MFLLNNTELFLLGISLIGFVILSLYYLIAYARPLRASKRTDDTLEEGNKLPVSIIIYAKNDSENLKKHLPALLTQDYPEYQVVVINDGSSDDTDDTLKFFQNEYKHLYHTYVPSAARYLSRRKLAFTLGVKAAKYDILLFTERIANRSTINGYPPWLVDTHPRPVLSWATANTATTRDSFIS